MAKKKRRKKAKQHLDSDVTLYIYSLLIIVLSIIGLMKVGLVGEYLSKVIIVLVGNMYTVVYVIAIVFAILYMKEKTLKSLKPKYYIGILLIAIAGLTYFAIPQDDKLVGMRVLESYNGTIEAVFNGKTAVGGGIFGAFFYGVFSILFDRMGTYVVIFFLILLGILLVCKKEFLLKIKDFFIHRKGEMSSYIQEQKSARKEKKSIQREQKQREFEFIDYDSFDQETMDDFISLGSNEPLENSSSFMSVNDVFAQEADIVPVGNVQVKQTTGIAPIVVEEKKNEPKENATEKTKYVTDFKNYRLPSIRLLQLPEGRGKSGANTSAANESGKQLVYILEQFGVKVTLVDTHIGPSVTKFELRPENGVRVNRISNLQQDIKMGLAAKDIRIEAPIPGKSTVGIEIPNVEKTTVAMRDLMKSIPSGAENKKLLFALGKDLMGNCVYGELNKMPHLLIAGATGSGKSVCVNSIITSLLMRTKPDEVKMLLIDPKKVEFTQYAKIPHLMAPVITNGEEASRALKVIVKMMDDRYELFSKLGVRNISSYNKYLAEHPEEQLQQMPFIVVIIDELADLMLVAAKEVEASIQRITQLARAAGIHLIVATQRPSVDVITGVIKANIPSRIAFAVSSAVDSRTILDQQGAEKLLGLGDMLYIPVGEQVATRVQGCFVSDEEVMAISNFCSVQALPRYDDVFLRLEEVDSQGGNVSDFDDPLYEEVRMFVIESQKASTSFIQRKFSIGYSRAARLIDTLEASGVVGPSRGSKPREVFIKGEAEE